MLKVRVKETVLVFTIRLSWHAKGSCPELGTDHCTAEFLLSSIFLISGSGEILVAQFLSCATDCSEGVLSDHLPLWLETINLAIALCVKEKRVAIWKRTLP